ncbi:MAG: hypothetical protein ACM3XM_16805 [Mycobacterium leprae]
MSSLISIQGEMLPAWAAEAIELLKPEMGVMAKPVIINNIKRAAADPTQMSAVETALFLQKAQHGIQTFASTAAAARLTDQLRLLISRRL